MKTEKQQIKDKLDGLDFIGDLLKQQLNEKSNLDKVFKAILVVGETYQSLLKDYDYETYKQLLKKYD